MFSSGPGTKPETEVTSSKSIKIMAFSHTLKTFIWPVKKNTLYHASNPCLRWRRQATTLCGPRPAGVWPASTTSSLLSGSVNSVVCLFVDWPSVLLYFANICRIKSAHVVYFFSYWVILKILTGWQPCSEEKFRFFSYWVKQIFFTGWETCKAAELWLENGLGILEIWVGWSRAAGPS